MEVQVTLELADYQALNKCLLSRNQPVAIEPVKRLLWTALGGIVLFMALDTVLGISGNDFSMLLLGGLGGVLLGANVVWGIKQPLLVAQTALFQDTLDVFRAGPWTLSASPQGLTVHGPTFHTIYRWPHFSDVVRTTGHMFLLIGKYQGVIVPRHAFSSDQAFLDFCDLCQRYFGNPENPSASA